MLRWLTTLLRPGRADAALTLAALAGLALCSPAQADADADAAPAPAPLDDESLAEWDHFELSMGFLAGQRRYGDLRWSGTQGLPAGALEGAPFDAPVPALGLRYDVRLVVAYVRMTAGVDVPFTAYDVEDTRRTLADGRELSITELKPFSLRFGIGGELPVGPVAPFLDLLGSIDFTRATLELDGDAHELEARSFGFALRAGARLHVREWFFATASAEVGLVGTTRWGAELSVGFALM
ncbi:MAG TPA: hypothetical protein RMH85_05200 [Polyangiaceae bacterium LLY-WYZ-15_(1-7)]|nr:hypothetical protein [Myxococcales bacterium]MAT26196.1 hypothetical protein [Sandaracinus sp.]HJK91436.1 hypothetical protein [Polyangiaceae bacterium LLY-WYZ-15_(1-7)]HJL05073.1 hypothetical protein [Polyangiaceae bacterium LLY-WYZ-15_(1-7)]HJL07869.1 hypothetical protein [Polyangiaceae bacterium LLY-WYZ-15_(1-7)]